jgi:hypothetical protein
MIATGLLDEAYERLHHTGPEFKGWLSNHGPMAVDALLRMGQGDQMHSWISGYETRLEEQPAARWMIPEEQWREYLGDASRLGDWCALFAEEVHSQPWESLLARWWSRLLPGAIASATHGLIRTGHAVRALREQVTTPRLNELGQALGYWAARWQPIPGQQRPEGSLEVGAALDDLPSININGGHRTRIAQLAQTPSWPFSLRALKRPTESVEVPGAIDALVDAALTRYEIWGQSDPIMLIHAVTAPRAAALALPSLPQVLWLDTYDTAWAVAAAISSAYRSTRPVRLHTSATPAARSADEIAELAVTSGDEHAIKFAEVAQEAHRRGNHVALSAAARATELITHQ